MDDDSDSKYKNLKKFYDKQQEELDKLGMPPRPFADQGIDAYKEWEKEYYRRRDEYNRKNIQQEKKENVEDIEEEVPIQQPIIQQPINKNKLNIYVKLMSGDIIPLEVNSNSKVSTLKEVVREELKGKIYVNNIRQIVLFDNEGNYLKDGDIIKNILSENDIINVFINVSDDPPFKGERWIKLNYSKRELKDYKKQTKKINPAMKFNRWTTYFSEQWMQYMREQGRDYPVQIYEGNLDDFLALPGVTNIVLLPEFNREMLHTPNMSLNQEIYLRLFRESIDELGYDNLRYVYGVYNLYDYSREKLVDLVATNNDSSIVYELSGGIVYVFINGFKMSLHDWLGMNKSQRLKFLTHV